MKHLRTFKKIDDFNLSNYAYPSIAMINDEKNKIIESSKIIISNDNNPEVMAICYNQGWAANANYMTEDEAKSIREISQEFKGSNIVHFDEFKYFTNAICDSNTFSGCTSLQRVTLPRLRGSNDLSHMFDGCINLVELNSILLDTEYLTNASAMFNNCQKLSKIFILDEIKNQVLIDNMFDNLPSNGILIYNHNFDYTNIVNSLNSNGRNWTIKPRFEAIDCLSLNIKAYDVEGFETSTNIEYNAIVTYRDNIDNSKIFNIKENGISESTDFGRNPSESESRKINIEFTYINKTATTEITQEPYSPIIMTSESNPEVMAICYNQRWAHNSNFMLLSEAEAVTNIGTTFSRTNIVHFDEFQYFTNAICGSNTFSECTSLKSIILPSLSGTTNMNSMFYKCNNLTSLDLSNLDTSKVTNMYQMFARCNSLTSIDLSSFNTSNVTEMEYMFYGCYSLTSIDLSSFNTSNVTEMEYMFYNCSKLTSINVSNFDTSNVTDMSWMFYGCSSLNEIISYSDNPCTFASNTNLPSGLNGNIITLCSLVDTYKTNWVDNGIFTRWTVNNCVEPIYSNLVITADNCIGNVTTTTIHYTVNYEFEYNGKHYKDTEYGNVISEPFGQNPSHDTSREIAITFEKYGLTATTTITQGAYDDSIIMTSESNPEVMQICYNQRWVANLDYMTKKEAEAVTDIGDAFAGVYQGTTYDSINKYTSTPIKTFNEFQYFTNAKAGARAFAGCSNLTSIILPSLRGTTDMSNMFNGCSSLTELDLSKLDTSNVTDMNQMFAFCSNLTSLDLSNFNTSQVSDMSYMFARCNSLTSLDLSNFDTSKVTNMKNMFVGCSSLTTLDISKLDTSNVTNMHQMFARCNSLTSLDLSNFNTSKAINNMYNMFYGCSSLKEIISYSSNPCTFTDTYLPSSLNGNIKTLCSLVETYKTNWVDNGIFTGWTVNNCINSVTP